MARRSARLASAQKASKPPIEEPVLPSVVEQDDSSAQNDDAAVASPAPVPTPTPAMLPATPAGKTSRIKPPATEMHPAKHRPTMAPPSSGLRLGFTDIVKPASRIDALPTGIQTTPSKISVPSSSFTFTRPGLSDMKLGPEAQRMMDKIRSEAVKIKAELVAKRELESAEEEQINSRKIATAKGKAGRFSSAHMSEFKKMDSIENHPSAFRAQSSRITPLKPGVKRSQSKANLDEADHTRSKQPTPASTIAKAKQQIEEVESPVKRARQRIEEDATSQRPISRDGSSIPMPKSSSNMSLPRSKSNLASLMTPTKSSLARSTSTIAKTPVRASLLRSPSKLTLGGLTKSATTSNITTTITIEKETRQAVEVNASKTATFTAEAKSPEVTLMAAEVKTPKSRFEQVKSLFRRSQASAAKPKSTIPMPSALGSKTPGPPRLEKELPPIPMTTPARKLTKRVAFTPNTEHAALAQNSPSPVKSSTPVPATRQPLGEVHYPSLDGVLAEQSAAEVAYPDLTAVQPHPELSTDNKVAPAEPSVPGTFTFRSDHTISFGGPSSSFGSSPGQASIRPVRPSILPTENMPGSFPRTASETVSNKENEAPRTVFVALPHGMSNKKRHRVSTDEEEEEAEREAAERAAKKRKQVPEGDALLAPRLVAAASAKRTMGTSPRKLPLPNRAPGTPSPMKKKTTGGISLSRLQALSRPKMRK
ncbi:hypothetical protein QBC40DRAFT_47690 [Triangularia verruculosa]|uniref:Erythromycin esterase n=1 Tax=Triangularia verruculosa TaxID=2587418 RepID=A0AAN6XQ82_9PEZI|nr:hypothetical protein QBC40DRAFT_47690 [Triangularia verruculosa]